MSKSREDERVQVANKLADERTKAYDNMLAKEAEASAYLKTLLDTKYPYSNKTEEWHVKFSSIAEDVNSINRIAAIISMLEIVPGFTSEHAKMRLELQAAKDNFTAADKHQTDALQAFDMRTAALEREQKDQPEKQASKPLVPTATALSNEEKIAMIKELKLLGFEVRNPETKMKHLLEPLKNIETEPSEKDIERLATLFKEVGSIAKDSKQDKMVRLEAQAAIAQECKLRMSTLREAKEDKMKVKYQELATLRLEMLRGIVNNHEDKKSREQLAGQLLTSAMEYGKGTHGAKKDTTKSKKLLDELRELARENPDNARIKETAKEASRFLKKNQNVARADEIMTTENPTAKQDKTERKNPFRLIQKFFSAARNKLPEPFRKSDKEPSKTRKL